MHKPEDVNITYIPRDFKVSLTLFNLSVHRFLQFFIDHVSFYDALFSSTIDPYELATRTMSKYSFEKKEFSQETESLNEMSAESREQSIQAVKAMAQISVRIDLNARQKRRKAKQKVQKLFNTLNSNTVKATTLYLNEEQTLRLSPDFCLLCELHRISPIEHLTNVMEQISEADIEARSGLNKGVENPAVGFYLRVRDGYGNLYIDDKPVNPKMLDYVDELQKMRLSLFIYRSVEERTKKHRELLEKYYNLITI